MIDSRGMADSSPVRRRTGLLLLLAASLAAWVIAERRISIPEAWNPWAPLQIDAPPNLLTGLKLASASADREACLAALAQADMRLVSLEDRVTATGCGFENAVRIERTSVAVGAPFSLSCRAALSLALWERHVLQDAALVELGARVQAIEHFGSYACRNLYGQDNTRRSQHASADALDIAAFVLTDGRRISVVEDWESPLQSPPSPGMPEARAARGVDAADAVLPAKTPAPAPESRFLQAIHGGACRYFDAVLGPDYNRAHADHFHFDRSNARVCR